MVGACRPRAPPSTSCARPARWPPVCSNTGGRPRSEVSERGSGSRRSPPTRSRRVPLSPAARICSCAAATILRCRSPCRCREAKLPPSHPLRSPNSSSTSCSARKSVHAVATCGRPPLGGCPRTSAAAQVEPCWALGLLPCLAPFGANNTPITSKKFRNAITSLIKGRLPTRTQHRTA
jgi:hypothetical protein